MDEVGLKREGSNPSSALCGDAVRPLARSPGLVSKREAMQELILTLHLAPDEASVRREEKAVSFHPYGTIYSPV